MRSNHALTGALLFLASSVQAAAPAAGTADPVTVTISEVLRQQGFDGAQADALAERIAARLARGVDVEGPRLVEREVPQPEGGVWNDALARQVNGDAAATAARITTGQERMYPENVANFVVEESHDAGRLVILKHLKQIEDDGRMSASIATDGYWYQVFASQGYGDVYDASRDMLKRALRAGLRPYKEGKGLDAKQFAQLAARALSSDASPAPAARPVSLIP